MIDRSRIGFSTPPTEVRTDSWRVKLFCQAIGEGDPIYCDPDAARSAGLERCPLPPTFLKAIEGDHFSSAAILDLLTVPLRGVLHAEQAFEYLEPVYVDDVLTVSRSVSDIHDKKGGALSFIVIDTSYEADGRLVATSRQTVVVRHTVVPA